MLDKKYYLLKRTRDKPLSPPGSGSIPVSDVMECKLEDGDIWSCENTARKKDAKIELLSRGLDNVKGIQKMSFTAAVVKVDGKKITIIPRKNQHRIQCEVDPNTSSVVCGNQTSNGFFT